MAYQQPARCQGGHRAEATIRSGADRDSVVDLDHARRQPGDTLRFLSFCPGANGALEDHFVAIRFDSNMVSIDFSAASKGLLDLRLDLGRRHTGLEKAPV